MPSPASAGPREVALRSRCNAFVSSKQRPEKGAATGKVVELPCGANFELQHIFVDHFARKIKLCES